MSTLQQRIAALQQRSATSTTPNPTPLSAPLHNSLRDKIARFEKKGGLPVPARRAGDLYANRLSPKPQPHSDELHKSDELQKSDERQKSDELQKSDKLHVKVNELQVNQQSDELHVKANQQISTPLSQSKADAQISIPLSQSKTDEKTPTPLPQSETNEKTLTSLSQSKVDEQISIPLPKSEKTFTSSKTNEQTLVPLPQSKVDEQISMPLPKSKTDEQTITSLPQSKTDDQTLTSLPQSETNEQTLTPSKTNKQTLAPLPQSRTSEQTFTPASQLKTSISLPQSETNEQILTPLPQSRTTEQTFTSSSQSKKQTLTPLSQSNKQTLAPLSKAHEQTLTLLSKAHEQTPTPLPQSEFAKELQSVPILAVNDQDQTPSSPTTPHAPTFNLSSTLKGGPLATTSPERLAPSNVHRPLSMPPISFSASSNPITSTPIQDIYYDRDAKATDDDRTVRDEPEIQTQPESRLGNKPGSVTALSSDFRATIHHKVSEPPLLLPQSKTPVRRVASAVPLSTGTSLDPELLSSPMFGDLTDLLQSTVLLQERLEQNVIPVSSSETTIANSGVPVIVTDEDHDDAELGSYLEVRRLSKEEVEENQRTLWKLQAKREEQARSKVRNGFFGPFGRASKDVPREASKGVSIDGAAVPSQQQQLYSKRSKSPSILSTSKDIKSSSDASGADTIHSKTLENQSVGSGSGKPSSLSPKSPKSGLSAFRLLGSRSSPSSAQDCRHGRGRNSVSTSSEFSSEDSAPSAVTPPDGAHEFGGLRSWLNKGSPQSKKGGDGLGNGEERDRHVSRAVTFAGKIWQRARTRSGASTRSVQSLRGESHIFRNPLNGES